MAKDLEKGTKLKSLYNAEIIIDKKLGEGGQGFVYKVDYNGQPKALKIYKPGKIEDPKEFYNNLKNNVAKGAPNDSFLWPTDILKWNGTTFGYIMDLRPSEYVELKELLNNKQPAHIASMRAAVTAAIEMASAFRILHSKGYSYQDLSAGNFFINPNTGKVLICDNDNVTEYGKCVGVLGTPGYMAPEIFRGEAVPSTHTDRFSLAVVIFILLTMTHPLEGRRFTDVELLSKAQERVIYGTEPIFILDPTDRRNGPVAGTHNSLAAVWPELPQYIRDAFTQQFSKEVMMNPNRRATEGQWLELLTRLRSEIIYCPHCQEEFCLRSENNPVCKCGKRLPIQGYLALSGAKYKVPISYGNMIYKCQLGPCNIGEDSQRVLLIRPHPTDARSLIAQNVSGKDLTLTKPAGNRVVLKSTGAMLLEPGSVLDAFGTKITVQ